jgi:aspartyl-tRNA(Asn)/glutamyl-tRNA(Gln) amidotransferase subunit A
MRSPTWPWIDLADASAALERHEITATQVMSAHLARIEAFDGRLNACVTELADEAMQQAARADERWQAGRPLSPIDGLPMALKDNFDMAGVRTTNGTRSMADRVAERDAVAVARLRAAGVAFVAKVNLDELALGGSSDNPVAGRTLNPWDAASVTGGSSGGSAAAVAAGMCMAATASDTGGSIRNPSAWCGVAGLKTSNGSIDTTGVVPLSPTLDTVGYLARTVSDLAILFAMTADFLADDPEGRVEFVRRAAAPVSRPVLGVATQPLATCEPAVQTVCLGAIEALRTSSDVTSVDLPPLDDSLAALLAIMLSEAADVWGPVLEARPDSFGLSVLSLLRVGAALDATSKQRAMALRHHLTRQVDRSFAGCDAILMPSMGLAPRADAYASMPDGPDHPMWRYAARLTCLWNLSGNPVVSLPCGFTGSGRPVAIQIVGVRGREGALLRVASVIEQSLAIPRDALVPTWVAQQGIKVSGPDSGAAVEARFPHLGPTEWM